MRANRDLIALTLFAILIAACTSVRGPYETKRDNTKKGAGIGAAAGAVGALLLGEREADEILAGAAIGAAVGAGTGAYMDKQEERFARIPGTSIERISRDVLLVHFDSSILFDVDSATVRPEGRGALEQVGGVLNDFPKTAVVVQGHTDSTGSEQHNLALSQSRAEAARNYLVARGVTAGRMTALGYGEGYPVASNGTSWGRQQNRRVDVLLKAKAT
jgi:outer membrane protein OmpA-like peptidoglycan-associated protein